ncbi:hypothetical protein [Sediminispirochaeta smaragdinae]|uniref:Uncharacterized protein n=1 Tax=Sediminispirochaeta smaragdinae (strain DSM 11293 / JCM 15392 / SEBR 4228) TaxID=573413 RepID=E1R3H2_SEDSS|nr:hypothetical protein [Sediminispirochaeta smaragdinae]ADK81603.1 hypothetical protein Spirs_2490 [Sediminispirochaeta smaragdinae DSM 11293]
MAKPITIARDGVYVPSWGNKGRKKDERITVHYRFLTFEEEEKIYGRARREAGPVPDKDNEAAYEGWYADYLTIAWVLRVKKMITGIDNLVVCVEGNCIEVDSGEQLFSDLPLVALASELMHELKSLTSVDKKK